MKSLINLSLAAVCCFSTATATLNTACNKEAQKINELRVAILNKEAQLADATCFCAGGSGSTGGIQIRRQAD
jgi:hypothetical protein